MKSEGLFQLSKAFFRCGDASLLKGLWLTAITGENEQHLLSFTAVFASDAAHSLLAVFIFRFASFELT